MKLSVFWNHAVLAAEQQQISMPVMLQKLRRMGFSMLEFGYDELQQDAAIPALVKDAGFVVSSVYASLDLAKDGDASLAEPVIECAANIGAGFIMPIPRLYTAEDAVTIARERDNIAAAMQKLVSMAAQANLRVTIEDFDSKGSPILNSDGMLYFLKAAPGLTAAFDTGNFRYACEDTLSAFTALAPYIAHAHLKDRALNAPELGNPTTALDGAMLYPSAVGDGIVPIREILQKLQGIGYQGALTVEHFAHTDPFGAISRSAAFVKSCVTIED